jgi:hypothetical protein
MSCNVILNVITVTISVDHTLLVRPKTPVGTPASAQTNAFARLVSSSDRSLLRVSCVLHSSYHRRCCLAGASLSETADRLLAAPSPTALVAARRVRAMQAVAWL